MDILNHSLLTNTHGMLNLKVLIYRNLKILTYFDRLGGLVQGINLEEIRDDTIQSNSTAKKNTGTGQWRHDKSKRSREKDTQPCLEFRKEWGWFK